MPSPPLLAAWFVIMLQRQQELDALRKELAATKQELSVTKQQREDLDAEKNTAKAELEAAQKELAAVQAQHKESSEKASSADTAINSMKAKVRWQRLKWRTCMSCLQQCCLCVQGSPHTHGVSALQLADAKLKLEEATKQLQDIPA